MERILIEQIAPDAWRWVYSDGNGSRAMGNDVFTTRAEAERSARVAFPDLEAEGDAEMSVPPGPSRSFVKAGILLLVALMVVALGWSLAGRDRD